MIQATAEIVALMASGPRKQFIADLYTFNLRNGENFYFTNKRRPINLSGIPYTPAKMTRGKISLSRGMSVDSHQVRIDDASSGLIQQIRAGYFNRADFTLGRAFKATAASAWMGPLVKFFGRVDSVDEVGEAYALLTAKSRVNDLDNDFPRVLIQKDCNHVLYDAGCTLSRTAYLNTDAARAGTTQNLLVSTLPNPDGWFNQGIVSFSNGALAGISYFVRQSMATGLIYPAYPFLVAPAIGDHFVISPGCDKTLATCSNKFGNTANFLGMPFIPDPTTAY